VSIRWKVALVSLVLLVVPWLAYRYALELERFLRVGQALALSNTARAVALALADKPQLFAAGAGDRAQLSATLPEIANPIHIDGDASDWGEPTERGTLAFKGATATVVERFGRQGSDFVALLDVIDRSLEPAQPGRPPESGDHLELTLVDRQGRLVRYLVAPDPGGVARVPVLDAATRKPAANLEAAFRASAGGYVVELRIPLDAIGAGVGLAYANVEDAPPGTVVDLLGTSGRDSPGALIRVFLPEREIERLVQGFSREGSRLWVLDRERRVLSQTGSLHGAAPAATQAQPASWYRRGLAWLREATVRRVYRLILQPPSESFADDLANAALIEGSEVRAALAGRAASRWRLAPDGRALVLAATQPIAADGKVVGVVLAEETSNEMLALRNRALEGLFTRTLVLFALTALVLLAFATRLSARIRRLRNEAEAAVDSHGRVQALFTASRAGDEIGDLSRSFSTLLRNLSEYTGYLEKMASRLSHELRTPIAVVRSSLENLALEKLPDASAVYLARAQEGVDRLNLILNRMAEATRLEHTLANVQRERFDLAQVVQGCVAGYRSAYPAVAIRCAAPQRALWLDGAPDLIAQLLDKLVGNAIDFATPGTPILVRLAAQDGAATLAVINDGPPLPEAMRDRLFDSLVSVRADAGGGAPHLGLGLYIVRLIAEFHGGRAQIANRADGRGVEASVSLPLEA